MKYQIGSGLVSGKERIILHAQGKHIDVLTVLSDARLTEALSLHEAKPASLMQMMQHWPYWRATLSRQSLSTGLTLPSRPGNKACSRQRTFTGSRL